MRILDAIQRGQKLVDAGELPPEDAVAVHCLVQLAKKVHKVQQPLRQLHKAICPKESEHLNQLSLIPGADDG